jgi:RNA polymerase sigma factor (sigma-70 family)
MSDIQNAIADLVPALRAFARTFCPRSADADDLVQDTLVRAIANMNKFEPGTKLKAWLFTIMRNAFYTSIKRYNREKPGFAADVASTSAAEQSMLPAQEWHIALGEMHEAINNLPEKQREMLVLIAVLGTSYEEAAEICGCEVGTVKSRLSRARASLLEALEGPKYDIMAA